MRSITLSTVMSSDELSLACVWCMLVFLTQVHAVLKLIVFTVGATVADNLDAWIRIDFDGKQRAFKVTSLCDSQKTGACQTSIPFAILNDKKEVVLNEDALKLLKTITKPVAVLTICGKYRTGKSYYLSRFLGDKPIFETSDKLLACTKGMMMATIVLECDDFAIVLLDTEGTNSIGENEQVAVTNFIVLSSLLSSVLVYNSKGAPGESDVKDMR